MVDFKPDILIYLGDQLDMGMIMDFWQGKVGSVAEKSIVNDYRGFEEMMEQHIKLCGKPKVVFFEGNHEERVRRYLQQQPLGNESNIELEKYFQFEKRGIEFIPYNKFYNVGKLYFMHGLYYNDAHAKKTVGAVKRSIIYGHVHDHQVYTDISPFDVDDVHMAKSIGCLCNKNPDYKKNQPSHWTHGFGVAYVQSNGNFNDYFIKITKGQFIFNGKKYA
jgi:hypothetical protein